MPLWLFLAIGTFNILMAAKFIDDGHRAVGTALIILTVIGAALRSVGL